MESEKVVFEINSAPSSIYVALRLSEDMYGKLTAYLTALLFILFYKGVCDSFPVI